MAKFLTWLTFSLFFYTVFSTAYAQGSWNPAGASSGFPRTLLKASEIPAVQQSLTDPERQQIFASVYGWAVVAPPTGNTDDMDRRMRARSAKNQAFVRIMDRKAVGNNLELLSPAERTQFETNTITLL